MRLVRRYCPACRAETVHRSFVDVIERGAPASKFERLFAAFATLGLSEALIDRWIQCERCGLKREDGV